MKLAAGANITETDPQSLMKRVTLEKRLNDPQINDKDSDDLKKLIKYWVLYSYALRPYASIEFKRISFF